MGIFEHAALELLRAAAHGEKAHVSGVEWTILGVAFVVLCVIGGIVQHKIGERKSRIQKRRS